MFQAGTMRVNRRSKVLLGLLVVGLLGLIYVCGRWSGRASMVAEQRDDVARTYHNNRLVRAKQPASAKQKEIMSLLERANMLQDELTLDSSHDGKDPGYVKWALFTTMDCKRFGAAQQAAFNSWDKLVPRPHIYLLSQSLPPALKGKVNLIPHFDETFDNLPLFSGMMFRTLLVAAVESMAVVAWVNADILLAPNVATTIGQALKHQKIPWLILGSRHNIPHSQLYAPSAPPENLAEFILTEGKAHTTGGIDLFAWNQPHKPIVRGPFPPFIRTANIWDNWWVTEASATRLVVDAGVSMTLGHIEHARYDNAGKEVELEEWRGEVLSPWTSSSWSDWHNYHNRAVLLHYQRGYTTGVGTPNHVPVQVDLSGSVIQFAVPSVHKPKVVGQKRVTEYTDRHMKDFPPEPSKILAADRTEGVRYAVWPRVCVRVGVVCVCHVIARAHSAYCSFSFPTFLRYYPPTLMHPAVLAPSSLFAIRLMLHCTPAPCAMPMVSADSPQSDDSAG